MCIKVWKFNRDIIRLKLEDILYIESYKRRTVVHTRFGAYRIQTTLKQEEAALGGSGFLRVHQRYLVQVGKIRALKGNYLVLYDGKRIPISYRNRRKVYERLIEV